MPKVTFSSWLLFLSSLMVIGCGLQGATPEEDCCTDCETDSESESESESDSESESETATDSRTVEANDDYLSTTEGVTRSVMLIELLKNDEVTGDYSFKLGTATNGTVKFDLLARVAFTPNEGFCGAATYQYALTLCSAKEYDEELPCTGKSDTATVNVTVKCDDEPLIGSAPFRSPAKYVWDFSREYVATTNPCGQALGTLPGASWQAGPDVLDEDNDGYYGMYYEVSAGLYDLTYAGAESCDHDGDLSEAQYGSYENLSAMTAAARAFIQCNWWNEQTVKFRGDVTDDEADCWLRVSVDDDGDITPAGNMANFDPDADTEGTTEPKTDCPAPVVLEALGNGSYRLEFSPYWLSATPMSISVRGNLPGQDWNVDRWTSNQLADDRFYTDYSFGNTSDVRYHDFSYVSSTGEWANYGASDENILCIPVQYRAALDCNWWNGSARVTPAGGVTPSCKLLIKQQNGVVSFAGNMGNFNG